jgi:hypothetical protein
VAQVSKHIGKGNQGCLTAAACKTTQAASDKDSNCPQPHPMPTSPNSILGAPVISRAMNAQLLLAEASLSPATKEPQGTWVPQVGSMQQSNQEHVGPGTVQTATEDPISGRIPRSWFAMQSSHHKTIGGPDFLCS